ncbi:CRISPR-associated protein Csx20 [Candidatus Cetobacterium colombiensis]|uniref:CRISPR-associated protein Csx20 n=1 Tax=Candidatus Cetobacterium colombiensis TaxID=3073100 RepID=A0ABU4WF43_9FUSO|nr:CRISPR-associated protein Csx20 [Candidatus Cetobacterium colombiensis]MDX8337015.1 CRISPR-associated protein Csx20 [Candidatus Cetobacterium colombiensis]
MTTMFLLFSHKLTNEQIISAKKDLNCENLVYLPEELQKLWSNTPPTDEGYMYLTNFETFILNNYKKGDYALIQGDWGYTYHMVNFCKKIGVIPVYSTTERNSKDIINNDGSISKISIFKHVIYKRY